MKRLFTSFELLIHKADRLKLGEGKRRVGKRGGGVGGHKQTNDVCKKRKCSKSTNESRWVGWDVRI